VLNVAVPELFSVRPYRYWLFDAEPLIPPLLIRIPWAPAGAVQLPFAKRVVHKYPLVHVNSPLRLMMSLPDSVPVNVTDVIGTTLPVTKLAIPLIVTGTVKVLA
jgi:hypothetical protein